MKVVVVGGGASGLMAAYAAAKNGHEVVLVEKNEKLGKKIYITGKGRCNLTNNCPPDEFLQNVVRGEKFLRGAVYRFPPSALMQLLEANGLPLKTERGNRVFPVSDHASDVTKTLEKMCREAGVCFKLNTEVSKIDILHSTMRGIITQNEEIFCDFAVIATGGLSYPSTGSTGDGLKFAQAAGHTVVPCVPSLVGIGTAEDLSAAQGISVKNCVLTCRRLGKPIFSELGELLFTHFGVSGPLVLSLSARVNRLPTEELSLTLDFKPALGEKQLDLRVLRDFSERKNERMKNVIRGFLPQNLGLLALRAANISPEKQANAVTAEERRALVAALKAFPLTPLKLRGYDEAVVTSGGVSVAEIDPKTMQSKLVKGLAFCGETIDADAYTGGFNLHIAFATGYAAGSGIPTA